MNMRRAVTEFVGVAFLLGAALAAFLCAVLSVMADELIGPGLGMTLTMVFLLQAIRRALRGEELVFLGDGAVVPVEAWREEQERRNTGVWTRNDGYRLSVRWDPVARVYFLSDEAGEVCAWPDMDELAAYLVRLEESGQWFTGQDKSTRAIRARLDLPGWETEVAV